MSWWSPYIGKPFEDGGRGPEAYDCWGLVAAVYRDVFGIELPSYGEISASDLIAIAREMRTAPDADPWRLVREPRAGDVCVMRLPSRSWPGHVGVMVDRERVMHVERATHVCTVPTTHPMIASRVLGYRRHRVLA